jgi:hypothetical protein
MPSKGKITPSQFAKMMNYRSKEIRATGTKKQDIIDWITANGGTVPEKTTIPELTAIMNAMPPSQVISEFTQTAISYADEVIMDILGVEREQISAKALEHGNTYEPVARARYEIERFCTVPTIDESIPHPIYNFVAGIPDGLVYDDGIIEIKCPSNSANHLSNILQPTQYEDYKYQIQGYLWITGRKWCDFVSYDPRFPKHLQIAIHNIKRDEELIQLIETRAVEFWALIQERLKRYL